MIFFFPKHCLNFSALPCSVRKLIKSLESLPVTQNLNLEESDFCLLVACYTFVYVGCYTFEAGPALSSFRIRWPSEVPSNLSESILNNLSFTCTPDMGVSTYRYSDESGFHHSVLWQDCFLPVLLSHAPDTMEFCLLLWLAECSAVFGITLLF